MKTPYIHTHLFYKHLMRMIDYKGWAEYLHDIICHYDLKPKAILELAAGDCTMSEHLQRHYSKIYLSDISKNMLKSAKVSNDRKVVCDMCALPYNFGFDLVIAAFDSLNYLLTENELQLVFHGVNKVLSPGGIFTFDVSLEQNSINNAKHLSRKGKSNGIKYKQTSSYDPKSRIHKNTFEIKLKNSVVLSEVHKQKIYRFDKYLEVIDKTNLQIVDCFEFFSFESASEACERVQFIITGKGKC